MTTKNIIKFFFTRGIGIDYYFNPKNTENPEFHFGFENEEKNFVFTYIEEKNINIKEKIKDFSNTGVITLGYKFLVLKGKAHNGPLHITVPGKIITPSGLREWEGKKEKYDDVKNFFDVKHIFEQNETKYRIIKIGESMFTFTGKYVGVLHAPEKSIKDRLQDILTNPDSEFHREKF